MMSISIIIQKYGFDMINTLIIYSQTKFSKLKTIVMIMVHSCYDFHDNTVTIGFDSHELLGKK